MHTVSVPLLEMRQISKRFPGVTALDRVDFTVESGEIHALIGQNGAGKSTLMKILAGVYPIDSADDGEIRVDRQGVKFSHPRDALNKGIGVVYQDLSLVPKLSVADNLFLGREAGGLLINQAAILERTRDILSRTGMVALDPRTRVADLPLAQQQLVEIAKVLAYAPRILVLDEPTAALDETETRLLHDILRRLRTQDIGIVYISHRFKEIVDLCDRATVLRNGKLVKTILLGAERHASESELVELTIGERIEKFFHGDVASAAANGGDQVTTLELHDFSVGRTVRDVSCEFYKGEVVTITGLLGAGQNELARALFGLLPETSGVVRVHGQPTLIASPRQAIRLGIGLLTDQRKAEGLVLEMNVRENLSLPSLRRFLNLGVFNSLRRETRAAQGMVNGLHVKTPSLDTKVNTLSGGNQQKIILGKWLLRDLDILLFISPTQGVDVGAKAEIYHQLLELARQGKTIIVVSEDLVEVLGISERVLVMYMGQLKHVFARHEVDEARLTLAVQGNIAHD